jgi:hypothetical protein
MWLFLGYNAAFELWAKLVGDCLRPQHFRRMGVFYDDEDKDR